MNSVRWNDEPDQHYYPAAASHLALIADPVTADVLSAGLRKAPIAHYKAEDILRVSGLPVLPPNGVHVARDVARIKADKALSPVLLVCGDIHRGSPLQIADGYHRVCASHHLDEDADIPCRIVGPFEPQ